jgi:hypothetical protein
MARETLAANANGPVLPKLAMPAIRRSAGAPLATISPIAEPPYLYVTAPTTVSSRCYRRRSDVGSGVLRDSDPGRHLGGASE